MFRAARFALLVGVVACALSLVSSTEKQFHYRNRANQDALKVGKFVQEMERVRAGKRESRQLDEVFGSIADITQILGLIMRLAQAAVNGFAYIANMMANARQDSPLLAQVLWAAVQLLGQGAVVLSRSYDNQLGDALQNMLTDLHVLA